MDYTQENIVFRIKKVLRYLKLYGLTKTYMKVRGQYHMKAEGSFTEKTWRNESCRTPEDALRNVALIGCGNYAFSTIAYYLRKHNKKFLRCAYDVNPKRALSICNTYGGAYALSDWQAILDDPKVEIVFIASNHASHAEYAISCIRAGKNVHIEKPHVVSEEQLSRLITAMKENPSVKVFLGFNRPRSVLFEKLQEKLASESGPLMINWFIAGHEIPDDHWYFNEQEGGRVLGNLCHWTDLYLHLVSLEKSFPCTIVPATPAGAKSDFVVSVIFADRSCASITFSAKGHTFEGVREVLNIHKGNVLANLSDFQSLTVDIIEQKNKHRLLHRDHGHEANILHSLSGITGTTPGEDIKYVAATARFFLAIRRAIDSGQPVVLSREEAMEV